YARAVEAGAAPVSQPATKPWGQDVAYVRDLDGVLIEIASPA
ncbi:MAG TPA: lyase, partial [Thermoanaerobaculia bacterium]|nr:lyase [Thermoanaerobaculia bacterium]